MKNFLGREFCLVAVFVTILTVAATARGQLVFTDNFNSGASASWGNERGNWTATGGVYDAQAPNNSPLTFSSLPFMMTDLALNVDVNGASDGGVWLHANAAGTNGILLVIGGNGWGLGNTGPTVGNSIYWTVVTNGVANGMLNEVSNVFTPGVNLHLTITVTGNTYQAYVNGTLETTYVDSTYTSGRVGLYDFSPASAANQNINQTFDNVVLAVPEPSVNWLLVAGFAIGVAGWRRRKVARVFLRRGA